MKKYSFLYLLILFIPQFVFSQVDLGATYFGNVGSAGGSHVIAQIGSGGDSLFFMILANPDADITTITLGAAKTATFTSTGGRAVTLTITDAKITGTIAGLAFSMDREADIGEQKPVAGVYGGAIEQTPVLKNYGLRLVLFPSGKIYFEGTRVDKKNLYGVGTRNPNGAVSVTLMNGVVMQFTLVGGNGGFDVYASAPGLSTGSTLHFIGYRVKGSTLINVSTRAFVTKTQSMTAGFVIDSEPKLVLIRAVGPGLTKYEVPNVNEDPVLTLFQGLKVLLTNDNWGENASPQTVADAALQAGAFPLVAGSKDAALLVRLRPGAYTAQVTTPGTGGDTLVEVYEVLPY